MRGFFSARRALWGKATPANFWVVFIFTPFGLLFGGLGDFKNKKPVKLSRYTLVGKILFLFFSMVDECLPMNQVPNLARLLVPSLPLVPGIK